MQERTEPEQERTREQVLADWEALPDAESPDIDINDLIAKRAALIMEARDFDPVPRRMWSWLVGFSGITSYATKDAGEVTG